MEAEKGYGKGWCCEEQSIINKMHICTERKYFKSLRNKVSCNTVTIKHNLEQFGNTEGSRGRQEETRTLHPYPFPLLESLSPI